MTEYSDENETANRPDNDHGPYTDGRDVARTIGVRDQPTTLPFFGFPTYAVSLEELCQLRQANS